MKVAIMQPYFFPYIGYFQLIDSVDVFVVYDNIQYTKKGWINRNRFLQNGKGAYFTIPLQKSSDYLSVIDRTVALEFNKERLLNQLNAAYKKAPNFLQLFHIFEDCILHEETNLFKYIYYSIKKMVDELDIHTKMIVSSSVNIDHSLRGQDKVMAICKELNANIYINAIGGVDLYSKEVFADNGIELRFIKSKQIEYKQFNNGFVPWLSIIDIMMFNDFNIVKEMLKNHDVI
ncbi:WbqC family protein [Paenibacillus sp. MZ04-78.2]|uniref:WbqC family protein n=1 Tax=Paenibacillus sp. MZ04-78.2 TaxID=2962034 RepID=UPI0020B6857B|nr:WbqC family protein [Paenibacillus sp. MZ04-78.2]MCP3775993.1 WbqC family protein [Paenibacillus sp. MZ04-78.2]